MDTRRAALCCVLLALVIFHANSTSVAADDNEVCTPGQTKVPFCKDWSCQAECWVLAKVFHSRVQEHGCFKGGFKGKCYCLFCRKKYSSLD